MQILHLSVLLITIHLDIVLCKKSSLRGGTLNDRNLQFGGFGNLGNFFNNIQQTVEEVQETVQIVQENVIENSSVFDLVENALGTADASLGLTEGDLNLLLQNITEEIRLEIEEDIAVVQQDIEELQQLLDERNVTLIEGIQEDLVVVQEEVGTLQEALDESNIAIDVEGLQEELTNASEAALENANTAIENVAGNIFANTGGTGAVQQVIGQINGTSFGDGSNIGAVEQVIGQINGTTLPGGSNAQQLNELLEDRVNRTVAGVAETYSSEIQQVVSTIDSTINNTNNPLSVLSGGGV